MSVCFLAASCLSPWQTKSNQLLKQFPVVTLIPDTNYSATVRLLQCWVKEYVDLNLVYFTLKSILLPDRILIDCIVNAFHVFQISVHPSQFYFHNISRL
jgi:hypothetical protein